MALFSVSPAGPRDSRPRAWLGGLLLAGYAAAGCTGFLGGDQEGPGRGAGDPGSVDGTNPTFPPLGSPFAALTPEQSLLKVKNLLTGQAPSDEEQEAYRSDPEVLPNLIDEWTHTPAFEAKMLAFFQVAFQQGPITDKSLNDQLGCDFHSLSSKYPGPTRKLLQNVEESFRRTAFYIVDQELPFSQVVNTRDYMLTPGLAGLLAYLDYHVVSDDQQVTNTSFFPLSFQIYHAGAELSAAEQVAQMRFYTADSNLAAIAGSDPLSSNGPFTLYLALMGIILGSDLNFPVPTFTEEDMSTWRLYRTRPLGDGEVATPFWDVENLRTTQELALSLPRVGFFTTPAFFATWQTNDSNQHRLTINQTLITALGRSFIPDEAIIPVREVSLDEDHASQADCRGCHKNLDPMRTYFRQAYSLSYGHQQDSTWRNQRGSFALGDVKTDGGELDQLADTLASHPLFAVAWSQKLCLWANSAECDSSDPEFQRVVSAFRESGLRFRVLIRELFSSPLVTWTKATQTTDKLGQIVSIARASHFCSMLTQRLGLADPCGLSDASSTAHAISVSIPADAFSRGKPEPILPTESNLFHRTAVEALCELVATHIVDQPGLSLALSSADPAAAVATISRQLMGLSADDERSLPVRELLHAHHQQALATGATATEALRSTFVVGCSSASSVGIGL